MPSLRPPRPGRLHGVSYVGKQRYLTLCTFERHRWFEDPDVVSLVRTQFVRTAADQAFEIPAQCMMPDHAHLLAEGTTPASDLCAFMSSFKQKTGFAFATKHGQRLWQVGYYDRMLRSDEATPIVVRYILENPVRAGLVSRFSDYPYSGSDRYTLEELAAGVSQG